MMNIAKLVLASTLAFAGTAAAQATPEASASRLQRAHDASLSAATESRIEQQLVHIDERLTAAARAAWTTAATEAPATVVALRDAQQR